MRSQLDKGSGRRLCFATFRPATRARRRRDDPCSGPGLASRSIHHDREHGQAFGCVGADPTLINRTLGMRSRPAQHRTERTSVPKEPPRSEPDLLTPVL
jgi:hypothetical protein